MSVNKAILVGNVGKDPEVRYLEKDLAVAKFSLATSDRARTLPNGTVVPERTEWHNIVAWRGLAEIAEKYIRKGSQVYVEGKIQTRTWEKDGVKHYMTEVLAETINLLGKRPDQSDSTAGVVSSPPTQAIEPPPHAEDDLPF